MKKFSTLSRKRMYIHFVALPFFILSGFKSLQAQNDPLIISCPPAVTILCSDDPYDPALVGEGTAEGGCNPESTFVYWEDFELVSGCSYVLERTWIALDECGTTATCTQIVTVIDNVPLTLNCPNDFTVASCNSSLVPQQTGGLPQSIDNCSETSLSWVDVTVGTAGCCESFVIERTWTAFDQCGSPASCVQLIYVPAPDCDDGDPCTEDFCVGGTCLHVPLSCNDGDPCTLDYCDANGECHNDPIVCADDGDPCTLDICENGVCVHVPVVCPQPEDACFYAVCEEGICTVYPVNCDDGDPCTTDLCENGICIHTPLNCDDGDPCTTDYCDANGVCHNDPVICVDDGDPCTLDFCENGVCVHVAVVCVSSDPCMTSVCIEGICVEIPIVCDDNDPCTVDECINGVCTFTPIECDDGDPNTIDFCEEGICIHTPVPCDDGDPCTEDILADGICTHVPISCDDNDPCTIDECINGVCVSTPINCDDNDPTTLDECINGNCVHTLILCTDNDPCTVDAYVNGVCTHTPMNCDDGDPCTFDDCVNGVCIHVPMNCDDGDPCTMDNCVNGTCTHTPINCNDGDPCTADACVNGVCQHTPIPGCGGTPPVAHCDYATFVFINLLHPDYDGPGTQNIYLVPASHFDEGSTSSSQSPTIEVKRVGSFVSFDWTTNGSCIDQTKNFLYNDPDKGKVYRNCLPVTLSDIFTWKSYKFKISDEYGTDECSGWYLTIPYFSWDKQGVLFHEYLTEENIQQMLAGPQMDQDGEPASAFDFSRDVDFTIFPNPGDHEVYATWISPQREAIYIDMVDMTSKTVMDFRVITHPGKNTYRLNTHDLPPGSYIIQFISDQEIISRRWIKAEK